MEVHSPWPQRRVVDEVFPLWEAESALARLRDGGVRGKVLLESPA